VERRRQGEWPDRPSGKTVSLPGKTTVDDALEKIAEAAGWNLVANTGRAGDRLLVLRGKAVPVEEALDAVLEGTPLVATRRGDTVTVAPGAIPAPVELPVLSGFDPPSGKRFSGDFDAEEVEDALKQVAEAGGFSLVLPPGVRGQVTARFKDAPVEQALKALLLQAGLVAQREGSIVTVHRGGGGRLVIRGSRRTVVFDGDEPGDEIGSAVAEALRGAGEEAKRIGQELDGRSLRKNRDQVVSGDHLVKPGERAHNIVALRGNVTMESGSTAEQVTAVGGSVELGPGVSVEREVVAILGDIHVSPGARVGGDAVSIGGKITIDEGGEVEGQQTSVSVPGFGSLLGKLGQSRTAHTATSPWLVVLGAIAEFAVFFVLGLLFLSLAPRRLDAVSAGISNAPLKTVLTGLVATVAMPVLSLLLIVTIIGIPLVAVQAVAVVVAGVLGFSALAVLLGRLAGPRLDRGGDVLRLALGTAVMVAVGKIPVIGTMAWITAWLFVFGAVVRTRFGQPPAPTPLGTTLAGGPPPPAQAA
jgi:hypothetical protein